MKKTSSNDIAAKRSETAVARESGTWEPLVLRLLIADTGRDFNAACTRKTTRDFTTQIEADAKAPFADVLTQCHVLDVFNCGPLLVVPKDLSMRGPFSKKVFSKARRTRTSRPPAAWERGETWRTGEGRNRKRGR